MVFRQETIFGKDMELFNLDKVQGVIIRLRSDERAEKILIICKVLDVTPQWLLSGVETHGKRSNPAKLIAVDTSTEKNINTKTNTRRVKQ